MRQLGFIAVEIARWESEQTSRLLELGRGANEIAATLKRMNGETFPMRTGGTKCSGSKVTEAAVLGGTA